ncbi:MAG: hypothetical protein WAL87_08045 [Chthoniobacterales bacterium]|jgi:hypothetical protein
MSTRSRQLSAATAAALLGLPVAAAVAQQMGEGSTATLREKLILSEAAIKGLTESLAVANGETELFKRKADDLSARAEALGIQTAGNETDALRTRLLAAVRDLRLLQKEKDAAREQLVALTESVMELLKTSEGIDAKSRLKVEERLRSASAFIGGQESKSVSAAGLTSGRVVDTKPDLALIVANLGSRQGVKTGMPFQVWRGEKQIASVRVVDVRDAVSGAIVQNTVTPADTVRTGDTLIIDSTR